MYINSPFGGVSKIDVSCSDMGSTTSISKHSQNHFTEMSQVTTQSQVKILVWVKQLRFEWSTHATKIKFYDGALFCTKILLCITHMPSKT